MTQHLSAEQINNFISRELSPDELLFADDHLSACDLCMNEIRNASKPAATAKQGMLFSEPDDQHLTYDQMSCLVDGSLDDVEREIVDVHRSTCSTCESDISDLRRMREIIAADAASPMPEQLGWFDRIFASPYFKISIPAAALVLIGSILWFTQSKADLPIAAIPDPTETEETSAFQIPNAQPETNANESLSRVVVVLNDGNSRIELDETGKITGLPNSTFEQKVRSALTNQTVEIPAYAHGLTSASGVWMGGPGTGGELKLVAPAGKVISSLRPTFIWQTSGEADTYQVEIFDDDFNKVATSPQLKTTRWNPSEPLKRGRVYRWKVRASKNGEEISPSAGPATEARFIIGDETRFAAVADARSSAGSSHLILGIAYANAGLLDDAQREFEVLVRSNPNSAVAKKLLAKIKAAK